MSMNYEARGFLEEEKAEGIRNYLFKEGIAVSIRLVELSSNPKILLTAMGKLDQDMLEKIRKEYGASFEYVDPNPPT